MESLNSLLRRFGSGVIARKAVQEALASVDQSAPTTETDAQQPDFMLPRASSVADRRRTVPRESSFHGATSTLLEDHSFASDGSINHAALLPAADSVGSLGSEITDGASRGRQTLSHAAPLPQELPPVHEGTLDSFVSSGSEAVGTGARVDEHEPASLGIQSTCSADATMSDGDALDLCDLLNASGGAALCLPAPVAFKERADAIITCSSVAIDRGRTWQDCTSSQCNECGRGDAVLLGSPPAEPTSSPSEVGGSTSHSAHAAKKAIAILAAATSVSPDMAPVTTESPGDAVIRVQQEQQDLLAVQRHQRLGQLRAQSKAGRAPRSAIRQQLWSFDAIPQGNATSIPSVQQSAPHLLPSSRPTVPKRSAAAAAASVPALPHAQHQARNVAACSLQHGSAKQQQDEAIVTAAPDALSSLPATMPFSKSQPAAAPTGPDGWPEGLGQPLSGSEQARALGAYNEERFQEHLAQLEGLLTARARARRAAAASSAADVDDLVSAVRMLECKAPPNVVRHDKQLMTQGISGNSECSSPQHLIAAVPAAGLDEVKPAAEQPAAKLAQEGDPVRPFPLARVKPLAQVKFEADSALRALACAPRRFTAPPPPQMTPEPLFERMQAEREQRLADDYTVQLEQLCEQECPSSYQQREKAAVAAAGPAAKELASCPNSPTFHAHQVPLSTMEGRYALLVAEMQLRGLRPSTAVLLSSNVRGAHLAQQRRRSE